MYVKLVGMGGGDSKLQWSSQSGNEGGAPPPILRQNTVDVVRKTTNTPWSQNHPLFIIFFMARTLKIAFLN